MTEREKKIMIIYINSAREIIDEYGLEEISIRKIAEKTGYNTATMYNYFENLDILLLYASIGYLKDYIKKLKEKIKNIKSPIHKYIMVYKVFNEYSFKKPDIFFNLFYGNYHKKLPNIIKDYYDLFPEELRDVDDEYIYNMLTEGNIHQRDIEVTKEFVKNNILSKKDVEFLVNTVVRVHGSYLYQVTLYRDMDLKKHSNNFIKFMTKLLKTIIGDF